MIDGSTLQYPNGYEEHPSLIPRTMFCFVKMVCSPKNPLCGTSAASTHEVTCCTGENQSRQGSGGGRLWVWGGAAHLLGAQLQACLPAPPGSRNWQHLTPLQHLTVLFCLVLIPGLLVLMLLVLLQSLIAKLAIVATGSFSILHINDTTD